MSLVRKSKREYYENLDVKCVQDNKNFWKKVSPLFSNKIKSKEKNALVENAEIVTEDSKLVKIFNDFFSTVVDKLNITINDDHILKTSSSDPVWASIERFSKHPSILNIKKRMGNISPKFKFQYVDQNQISKIQNLNSKKAMQQNDIPVKLLKENNDSFSYVIYRNFNNSIYEDCFPYILKTADLTPVYKKEEKFLKQNYRPVSILPNISKMFERCLYDQINTYFENILSKLQFGFRKEHSAQHCLIVLIEKCRQMLDKGGFSGILLTDLSKAFDCINHQLLIAKLYAYGFDISSVRYIHSYLTDRKQRVKINASFSEWSKIKYGAPQGSILGPLLFNIFICDLFFDIIDIEVANYSDDTTPYTYDYTIENVIQKLEINGNKIFQWFSDNYLKANPDKCHFLTNKKGDISINIKNENISSSQCQKCLGIKFDNTLFFDDHVSSICKKASNKLNALVRVPNYMNFDQRRLIMKAFITSQFGYCPLVWMFHSRNLNNRINNIHERALRITYKDYNSTFQDLLEKDNSVTVHQRNLQVLATEIFKTKNGYNPPLMNEIFRFLEPSYNLRNSNSLQRTNVKTVKYGTETLSWLGPKIWQLLPTDYKNCESLQMFKTKIKNWKTTECPCRLCKTYIHRIGFISW